MYEDFIFTIVNDFLQSINPLIKDKIRVEIAAPLIPKRGINKKFKPIPIIKENPHHLNATFSLPVILIIEAAEPKRELIIGESKIIKRVNFDIKNSSPKKKIINLL